MFRKYDLKVGCLNIGGNAEIKCTTSDIIDIINDHDIFIFVEYWLGPVDSCPMIIRFSNFRSERKENCKARRNSGEIIVYYRQNIAKGVQKICNTSRDVKWFKLEKHLFD